MKYFFLLLPIFVITLFINAEIDHVTKQKIDIFSRRAYSSKESLYKTYDLAINCLKNNIPGDFIECGVAAGVHIAIMAYACQQYNSDRKIHLFDSFEGIPLAGPNDTVQPAVGKILHSVNVNNINDLLISSNIIYQQLGSAVMHSLEDVQSFMTEWQIQTHRLAYHKGWFQNTLPVDSSNINKISFLRIDCALYESTKVCLEYLYKKVSKGGYIVIDDYDLDGCKKAIDEYLKNNNIRPNMIPITGHGPVYWQIQ